MTVGLDDLRGLFQPMILEKRNLGTIFSMYMNT